MDLENLKNETNAQISEKSLGIEHLIRELGQMYECVIWEDPESNLESSLLGQIRQEMQKVPGKMAQLVLQGFGLEIMDGENSCIPIEWIFGVFDEIGKITSGKKLCVISIVGVQSSGKSTALNVMFNLKFQVAVERCTKGINMTCLQVHPSVGLDLDYIVILDTEGLRSNELLDLDSERVTKDNEMATTVICLADQTLVNIMGHDDNSMIEVLQIATFAIIPLKCSYNVAPS